MKILVALDRFGDKLSSHEANVYIEEGIQKAAPGSQVIKVPLFDGTKDMIDGVLQWNRGKRYHWNVLGSQLQQKRATVAGIDKRLFIDCATLFDDVTELQQTSSAGLGQVILNGLDLGYDAFTVALGHTTVMDGGIGMLELLGARFYDLNGQQLTGPLSAADIKRIREIDLSSLDDRLSTSTFTVVSDQSYYLFGRNSHVASFTLNAEAQQVIDNNIWYLNEQFKKIDINLTEPAFGGDGGGLRAVFSAVLSAEVMTSKEMIFKETDIEALLEEADMVIFGGGTEHATKGSLVSQAIMEHSKQDKIFLYLTAGRQLPSDKATIYHFNIYPEMTEQTQDIQIGIQLQNTVMTLINMYR
ncbi:glycerate kinase [Macrococcus equipercicus]|uniref:Glycerate kinase n=1 Tax=Macrococcus equipercicus TaxID=69967 RepID=A0A9Q9BRK5_9STAP|nr:glycerate kinase [Macrococcus equipercicus]KAA1042443.1 glycerate kinase [Macrococcus equipercicus]UTH14329.1 glycerate kinase [Macrococcus equipercicus]